MSLLTEDEAKSKWCTLARYDESANRNGTNDAEFSPCIASACMAWRLEMVTDQQDNADPFSDQRKIPSGRGYCGAFGKPTICPEK